jgi:hypothetical protein
MFSPTALFNWAGLNLVKGMRMWIALLSLSVSLALTVPLGLWFVLLMLAVALSIPVELTAAARRLDRRRADSDPHYPGF